MVLNLNLRKDIGKEVNLIIDAFELGQNYLVDAFKDEREELYSFCEKIEKEDLEGANKYFKERANDFAVNLSREYCLSPKREEVEEMLKSRGYDTDCRFVKWVFQLDIGGKDWVAA